MKSKKLMQLYEPGPYEEFVGKLSSISIRPIPEVWTCIASELDARKRKRVAMRWRIASAASILLLISLSVSYSLINQIDNTPTASIPSISIPAAPTVVIFANLTEYQIIPQENFRPRSATNQGQDSSARIQKTTNISESIKPIQTIAVSSVPIMDRTSNISNRKPDPNTADNPVISLTKPKHTPRISDSWGVTAYLSPSYSYHTSAALGRTTYPREDGRWMWAGEVQVRKKFNNSFSLISGVSVNPTGQYIRDLILLQNGTVSRSFEYLFATTSYGQVNLESSRIGIANANNLSSAPKDILKTASMSTAALKQSFYHLEVPVMISMLSKVNMVDIELKMGASLGSLISNNFEVISSRGTFYGTTDGVRQINFAAIGAVSVSFPVTSGLSLVVEPNLRLGFVPISQSFNTSYPFNASVRFGVGYRF